MAGFVVMFQSIKKFFYFPIASYFRFFASFRLRKWNPRIIVVTGSSGKTSLLHLVEAQMGKIARYSHKANSSFGIPFNILNLHRKDLTLIEWPLLFLIAPLSVFKPLPKEKIYVVEADCDRPGEGKFLADLLKPEVTLWVSVSRTHSANFDSKNSKSVDEAIAHEFGYFAQKTKSLVIVNGDSELMLGQLNRVKCEVRKISLKDNLKKYLINLVGSEFQTKRGTFTFPYLLPKVSITSILMCLELLDYLNINPDMSFSKFRLPSGRSSFFKGIKGTTIVDSTYNANLDSMKVIIHMFGLIKAKNKWGVFGDMLEQGKQEKEEHEKLAEVILKHNFTRIILMGPRITKYTYPKLKKANRDGLVVEHFLTPKKVLNYLLKNIEGEELILFKGARFLEGVVGNLLKNKNQTAELARREKIWEIRRKKWGL